MWLHSGGLIAAGVNAYELTDTPPGPKIYAKTRLWGQAAYDAGLDGVVWVSRLWNTARALLLFGDRVDASTDLTVASRLVHDFGTSAGTDWLRRHGHGFNVTFL